MPSVADELKDSFRFVGINPDEEILKKCQQLCDTYRLEAEDFVDQWCAYTASHLNGAPPTLETLDQMERKDLQKLERNPEQISNKEEEPSEPHNMVVQTTPQKSPKNNHMDQRSVTKIWPIAGAEVEQDLQDTPMQRYAQRRDSQSIQCEYGNCTAHTFKRQSRDPPVVKLIQEDSSNRKYMVERLGTRAKVISDITNFIVQDVVDHYKLELTQKPPKDSSSLVTVPGRICSQSGTYYLESTLEINNGHKVKLEMSELAKYALFGGQIVVVTGNYVRDSIIVKQLYIGAPLKLSKTLLPDLDDYLQIVVAAGPFTLPDSLLYQPLADLIKYVVDNKPNILILVGPFLDSNHQLIKSLSENYDTYFEQFIAEIMTQLEATTTQVVLVPSSKDIHHHPVFPTLPYLLPNYDKLTLVTDPCLIQVNNLVMGITSTDVLFHLNKREYFVDKTSHHGRDKMARLASHLINQRCFYPLHPSDSDLKLDFQLLESYGLMSVTPDLMILPSTFKNFVKKVDGCLVINPERLTKGNVAGTYARLEVQPGDGPVCDRVSCQILRV